MEEISSSLFSTVEPLAERTVFRTMCGLCSGTCGMTVTKENGEVSVIEGDVDHPVSKGHLCPKGRAFTEVLTAKDRLRHPLRRTDGGRWEEISWNHAFGILAWNLRKILQEHGPEGLAVHVGQAGVGKEFSGYAERFCNVYGTPNFSTSGSHCCESKSMANVITFGGMPVADYENSKCIVLWGRNPHASTPSLVKEITSARKRGCALVVIDPRETNLAKQADFHLQIRPGTDGALALGMLHVIVNEALYNKSFVGTWTVGFDKLRARVASYTPERVERITWAEASKIREAARLYASSSPACISQGVALELATNGFQALRAIAILQAITANLDVSGGALFLSEADLTDLRIANKNGKREAIGAMEYPLFHAATGHAQANLYARAILEGKPYPLEGLIVAGSNPVLTWPNARRVRQALSNIGFLAVIDPFMTETSRLAHLVMPCATFLGENDLWDSSHLSSAPRIGLAPKVHDEGLPTNWEIWKEIATRIGHGDYFPWETDEEAIDFRLSSVGITFDDLANMQGGYGYHQWTPKKYEAEGFGTPSGKVEIYSAKLERHGYDPLPVYRERPETSSPAPGIVARYPLVLTTGARTLGYLHSRFRNVPSLFDRSPEPYVEVNPATARELHIRDGETVVIETRRGKIRVKVKCIHGILQKVISVPHGWDQANANVLTDDVRLDPVTGFPADRSLLARIVKEGG